MLLQDNRQKRSNNEHVLNLIFYFLKKVLSNIVVFPTLSVTSIFSRFSVSVTTPSSKLWVRRFCLYSYSMSRNFPFTVALKLLMPERSSEILTLRSLFAEIHCPFLKFNGTTDGALVSLARV